MRLQAAWTAGDDLIIACLSKQGGHYLVRVHPEDSQLVVTHSCSAATHQRSCWHIKAAIDAYREWRWWEPQQRAIAVTRPVVLSPYWVQIPIPGTEMEEVVRVVPEQPA